MKKHATMTALALVCLVSVAATGWSKPATDRNVKNQSKEAVQKEKSSVLTKAVNEDVSKGLRKVTKAVQSLDRGRDQEAMGLLKDSLGDFEVALAAEPGLDMVPVESAVRAQELYTNPESLKHELAHIQGLLQSGKVQEARQLILPLRSDISVSTTFLPMQTYPAAIRDAVSELAAGRPKEARTTLKLAMNTLVVTEDVVAPVPLIAARSLVDEASKMDKNKKDAVLSKLDMAKDQLQVGRLLGYLPKDGKQYEEIEGRIQGIMHEVKGENKVAKMFNELKSDISNLLPWSKTP